MRARQFCCRDIDLPVNLDDRHERQGCAVLKGHSVCWSCGSEQPTGTHKFNVMDDAGKHHEVCSECSERGAIHEAHVVIPLSQLPIGGVFPTERFIRSPRAHFAFPISFHLSGPDAVQRHMERMRIEQIAINHAAIRQERSHGKN